MGMTRREFFKKAGSYGGGGLLYLSANSWLLQGCAPNRRDAANDYRAQWQPAYALLETKGELARRVEQVSEIMEKCELCPRRCGVNRRNGQKGFCRAPEKAMVHSYQPHFGEELPLVGQGGSGTIFFLTATCVVSFARTGPSPMKDVVAKSAMRIWLK